MATASTSISTNDVAKAKLELSRMRMSLKKWLKYRAINDAVLAGTQPTKKPLKYAQAVVAGAPRFNGGTTEQKLATELAVLLEQVMPDATLPNSDLQKNPNAAVQLAQIALTGQVPTPTTPTPTSGMPPWLWPVLIVGGLLIAVTTAITSAANVATQEEQYHCIEAGACTDYGFWLKAGAVVAVGWFVWHELGVKHMVRNHLKKGTSRT